MKNWLQLRDRAALVHKATSTQTRENASRNLNALVPIPMAGKNRCSQHTLLIIPNHVQRHASSRNTASRCATNSAQRPVLKDTNCTRQKEAAVAAYLMYNQPALESWKESHLLRRMEKCGFKENARIANVKRVKQLVERFALS